MWIIRDKTVAALGLAFKPDTDDLRNAPSLDLIKALIQEGAKVKSYDPKAMGKARGYLPGAIFCKDLYQAAKSADCLIVATEWNDFKEMDFAKLKKLLRRPLIVDARNIYEPEVLKRKGFTYIGVGRGNV